MAALTNYMTGAAADSVTQAGGSILQLSADAAYSFLMWGVSFVTANFTLIILVMAIGFIGTYAKKKIGASGARKGNIIS